MFVLYALPVAALALLAGRFARLWLSGYPGWLRVVGVVLAVWFALAEIIPGDQMMIEPGQTLVLLGPPLLLWYLIKLWSRRAQWERRRLRRLFVALVVGYLLTLPTWLLAGDGLLWLFWERDLEVPSALWVGLPALLLAACFWLACFGAAGESSRLEKAEFLGDSMFFASLVLGVKVGGRFGCLIPLLAAIMAHRFARHLFNRRESLRAEYVEVRGDT